jgi:hypothetical protein
MAWISVRLVQHLSATPSAVAVLPGLLLTLALAGTAVQAVGSADPPPESREAARKLPLGLLGAAMVCSITWITLWLVFTTATAPWAAFTCGGALVTAVTAGILAAARPGRSLAALAPAGVPIPMGMRARRRYAQRRLRQHTLKWNLAAHQYGVTIAGSDKATYALACILSGDADPPREGIDPFDILILTALRKYHPAPLTASLNAAIGHLHKVVGGAGVGEYRLGDLAEFAGGGPRRPG